MFWYPPQNQPGGMPLGYSRDELERARRQLLATRKLRFDISIGIQIGLTIVYTILLVYYVARLKHLAAISTVIWRTIIFVLVLCFDISAIWLTLYQRNACNTSSNIGEVQRGQTSDYYNNDISLEPVPNWQTGIYNNNNPHSNTNASKLAKPCNGYTNNVAFSPGSRGTHINKYINSNNSNSMFECVSQNHQHLHEQMPPASQSGQRAHDREQEEIQNAAKNEPRTHLNTPITG